MGEQQVQNQSSNPPVQGRALVESILNGFPDPTDESELHDTLRAEELNKAVIAVQKSLASFGNNDTLEVRFDKPLTYHKNEADLINTAIRLGWKVEPIRWCDATIGIRLTRPKQGNPAQAKG